MDRTSPAREKRIVTRRPQSYIALAVQGMLMDQTTNRPAPADLTAALDASVDNLASGAVHDAATAQAEARRLLAGYERTNSDRPPAARVPPRRVRTA